ncbi:MAG: hypothetical protein H0X43_14185 [Nitrosospira sp.]|nr:hypothetical protein [Nitrosospira sp.]
MKVCKLAGCGFPVSGFSGYCEPHKRRNRRHGHPEQTPVGAHELEPFRKRARARIKKNRDNPTWNILCARWEALIEIAKAEETRYLTGAPHNRFAAEAWFEVVKIGANSSSMEVIEVALAVYLLQVENPRRFKSDNAFGAQLARRVRTLAPTSVGSYYDHETRKAKSVYRDARPKTTVILARILQDTFGVAGLTVAHLERHEMNKLRNEKQTLHDALGELV